MIAYYIMVIFHRNSVGSIHKISSPAIYWMTLVHHTGKCKSTGGYLQRHGVGLFRTRAGQNAIPTLIVMFV